MQRTATRVHMHRIATGEAGIASVAVLCFQAGVSVAEAGSAWPYIGTCVTNDTSVISHCAFASGVSVAEVGSARGNELHLEKVRHLCEQEKWAEKVQVRRGSRVEWCYQ